MQTTGIEIARFFSKHFTQDLSQRPEFELGFSSLSRTQMVKLSNIYDLGIDASMPGTRMAKMFEMWWLDGRFPVDPPPEDELANLKAEVAEMKAMMKDSQEKPNGQGITTTETLKGEGESIPEPAVVKFVGITPAALPPDGSPNDWMPDLELPEGAQPLEKLHVPDLAKLSWPQLKALAREKGIKIHGKKKPEIIAELEAL